MTPGNRPAGQRPYWASDTDTSVHPVPATTTVHGASRPASNKATAQEPALLAGIFATKRVAVNLAVLAALSAVVTGAVVLVVDLSVGRFTDASPQQVSDIIVWAVMSGLVAVAAGLLYIPVVTTGNERLYGAAVDALAVAAAAWWVVFDGLLSGDWKALTLLAVIICTAVAAHAAPSRIEPARVR